MAMDLALAVNWRNNRLGGHHMFLLGGILGITASAAGAWYALPKNGKVAPFVGTLVEPYVAIAITMGFMLSLGAIIVGIAQLL
jgi:hypothetical protein